jgi:hypothetical protein
MLLIPVIVSLYVLFLPTFGPLLDHHFAERIPQHIHIYLGQAGLDHAHPVEAVHGHSHVHEPAPAVSGGLSAVYARPGDIVYLAPYKGTGQTVATPALAAKPVLVVFLKPPADRYRSMATGTENPFQEEFVEPLKRPPRL